jgi:hypothetical protein
VAGAVAGFFFLRPGTEQQKIASATPVQEMPATNPAATEPSSTPAASTPAPTSEKSSPAAAPPLTRKQRLEQERKDRAAAAAAAAAKTPPQTPSQPEPPPQQKSDTKPDIKAEVTGSCQYTSDQLPLLLNSAETSRGRGQYKEAQRKVQAVLNCDRGNSKAKELLEQIRRAMSAGDGSSDPE